MLGDQHGEHSMSELTKTIFPACAVFGPTIEELDAGLLLGRQFLRQRGSNLSLFELDFHPF